MQLQNTLKAEALLSINNSTWFKKTAFCEGHSSPIKKTEPLNEVKIFFCS
jgi:hypothetical protein